MWKKIYNESDKSVKLIDTGLAGDKAKDILDSVIGQMSDGMWENSPAMEHYWPFIDVEMKGRRVYFAVSTEPWRKKPCFVKKQPGISIKIKGVIILEKRDL